MNIPFMQIWPKKMGKGLAGTPTFFIDGIWDSLPLLTISEHFGYVDRYNEIFGKQWDVKNPDNEDIFPKHPKPHTIRPNKSGRIKAGTVLQPCVWSGKPYHSSPFYFCPKIVCRGTQDIQISHSKYLTQVHIDDVLYGEIHKKNEGWVYYGSNLKTLAINDGFNSVEDFFKWFDSDFTGSIVHWTDLRY